MAAPFLQAFVDVGINVVRFSINSMEPKRARILPCVFRDRAPIAFSDGDSAIEPAALKDLAVSCLRFRSICNDYGVAPDKIQVVVSSSFVTVPNRGALVTAIRDAAGWDAACLTREAEYGANLYGIAASFHSAHGLYLKLGRNYIHLNWISAGTGELSAGAEPAMLPFGIVKLARLNTQSHGAVQKELCDALHKAVSEMQLPEELNVMAREAGGHRLYISGSNFRAVGRLLSSQTPEHPVPFVNGWGVTPAEWLAIPPSAAQELAENYRSHGEYGAEYFTTVVFLLTCVVKAVPQIRKIMYDQSGLREGMLFHQLPVEVRRKDPLLVATQAYALPGARELATTLAHALPADVPNVISTRILPALANSAYILSSYPQDLQASLGVTIATTGVLSGAYGLSHEVRILLGLALCNRWGGELSPLFEPYRKSVIGVPVDATRSWWALYLGHVMYVAGGAFPGARIRKNVIDFTVQGTAKGFKLAVRANENSIFCNNVVVARRINGLAKRLSDLAEELKPHVVPVFVEVEWYQGPVDTGGHSVSLLSK